jgi:hypothetical protein
MPKYWINQAHIQVASFLRALFWEPTPHSLVPCTHPLRQTACHPDLVLPSKTNGTRFLGSDEAGEATICRLCSDVAEDAIQTKFCHIFDRECMKQYLSTAGDMTVNFFTPSIFSWALNLSKPDCPVCSYHRSRGSGTWTWSKHSFCTTRNPGATRYIDLAVFFQDRGTCRGTF